MTVPTSQFRSKLESRYADNLFGQKHLGTILSYAHEPDVFHFGFDLRYTPDFRVETADGPEWHEVKGPFFRDDARVKLFACASAFPTCRFFLVRMTAAGWKIDRVRAVTPTVQPRREKQAAPSGSP